MTDKLQQTAQGATYQAQNTASEGSKKWDAMTEEQKKQTFDSLPVDKKNNKSYTEWIKEGYHHQYENWMPWIEDMYLKWFTKDNKASYATKDSLDKSKVTGVEQVDKLQDGVNNLAAGQVGQGGLLQPVGDAFSKEGINRAERGGKDDSGSYGSGAADSVVGGAKSAGQTAQNAGSSLYSGASSAAGSVTGMFGGGQKEGESKK
ncbi:hypothetical protein EJ03DRAFT_328938 [Teratosphaeria nubilosa]|uniref:Uncharacterized protein n=1 Tax=Teratosphaeria nubilosa TaxID=161662 RepID=A0A6G1L4A1_9PEZI|nr:hypothetical protein EJ03DRAFT_328938 [Teratosphaeria nubilosa]